MVGAVATSGCGEGDERGQVGGGGHEQIHSIKQSPNSSQLVC